MKAVFFDAGGTLIHIDHARVAAVIERVLGRRVAPTDFVLAEYAGRQAVEDAMNGGGAPNDNSRWSVHFRGTLAALGLAEADYRAVSGAILEEHRRAHLWCVPAEGAHAALGALRRAGYFVACISNADGTVDRLLAAAGLLEQLAFVIDSGVVGVEKPDPRIFEMALERSGATAAESIYVGDLWPVDVRGALAAGLEPVLLDPLGRYADRGVRTAPDIPSLARELVSAREAA